MDKNIWLIRHGETALNAKNIVQGQGINEPLNSKGIHQSKLFWEFYKKEDFDLVLYSDLIRSQQTIKHFLTKPIQGVELTTLKEISWGINEGLATSEEVLLRYNHAVSSWQNGNLDERVEGGESAKELGQRCLFTIDWLKQVERKNILICSHGRTIRALVCLLLEKPLSRMEEVSHKNLGLYRFLFQNGKWTCSVKDDITHLIP
ncbi:MAG: histidine phosphatase family protein [Saprospiraceae bacterium]|uniref:histidine phosphatase family protein n=1 Tax=Candidatus Brachybacter algidus TaxID=2982024 RepID=UPI001B68FF8F|nr:histidine phosphatase family protein [Candidatus Brachybacter algidus]MBP7304724.1 histidine phosphatase family protein [Saprospiraceae bacterium]MBK6374259.1 histidine phosphatase family protein [Candidatus Brachybacter algidus]MBK6449934.1 histidine phosphatase family protein [Candidatus Brachybacter algidus]MBK7604187.1 histidine phosphatase family protein [Candidatus Brachybacter algidus]MBK8353809.1 histidine phosphatase family protein [Candidatus Brachybacter algidus]